MSVLSSTLEISSPVLPAANAAALLDRARTSIEQGRSDGFDDLFECLRQFRNTLQADEWAALARALRGERSLSIVYQDPFTKRAFEKPRGYAGDAVMMDYLYGIHSAADAARSASATGRALHRYIKNRPAGQGVCNRRRHIARLIDSIAAEKQQPDILAIASGHLREAELSTALASGSVGRFVALDADAESLREVDARYSALGVQTVHASVRQILSRKLQLQSFDFVYAAGLYDHLNDSVGAALAARLFEFTKPGGQLLIPNFSPACPDRAYMETFMDWELIYRDEFDMTRLSDQIPDGEIMNSETYTDPSNSIVYLLITKTGGTLPS